MGTRLMRWLMGSSPVNWRVTLLAVALVALASCQDPTGGVGPVICGPEPEGRPLEVTCSFEPVAISGDPGFVTITAGHAHTCGLTAEGEAYCWGDNRSGQLSNDTAIPVFTQPVRVAGGQRFTTITAGVDHTCALTAEGEGYCWGGNSWGALGIGTVLGRHHPPVPVIGGITFIAISAGALHTCGIDTGGAAHCWGTNWFGQLGLGERRDPPAPAAVVGGLTFTQIEAGANHTCALTPEGQAFCWGSNQVGELGTMPTHICSIAMLPCSPAPVPVATTRRFVSLSGRDSHICALAPDGEAFCWGHADQGKRGPAPAGPPPAEPFAPTAIPGLRFAAIRAGGNSTCGITTAGTTLCWGLNVVGQLGTGIREYSNETPLPVLGGHAFSEIALGNEHTCGITTAGRTYCWGHNRRAQLGIGRW